MPYFSDKIGDYNWLKTYCDKKGIKVNYLISSLIASKVKKLKNHK